ncbi:hypothetical protein [Marinomonas sp.]|uniref:hypothetical protein n=1 Tax=Marinomonas sp. TaxID=1904862 RepID=UPI003BA9E449
MKLQLSLDKEYYTLGEVVSGHVDIELDSPKSFNEIYVSCFWDLFGKCLPEKHTPYKIVLHNDKKLLAAGKHQFPFNFTMDQYPISWQGDKLFIDWYVLAYADIPFGRDKKVFKNFTLNYSSHSKIPFKPRFLTETPGRVEIAFELFPKPEKDKPRGSKLVRRLPSDQPKPGEKVYEGQGNCQPFDYHFHSTLFSILLSLFAVPNLLEPYTFGWICTALWLFFAPRTYLKYRKELNRSRCGPILIKVDHQDFKPGQTLKIMYQLLPRKPIKIKKFTARIEMLESFHINTPDSSSSLSPKTLVHNIALVEEIEVKNEFELKPNEYNKKTLSIKLPDNLMHSLYTADTQLIPQITINLETVYCRNICATVPLNITPD